MRDFRFQKNGKEYSREVILTDGGVYENIGVQVFEPKPHPEYSFLAFPCEYIIACNAGQGREAGDSAPRGFFSRVARSFEVVHRRVQESTMHYLHLLQDTVGVKQFALPYLGQNDRSLPYKPNDLIPCEEVNKYLTNFAPMDNLWIEKISRRGEQLMRILSEYYLRGLL